MAFVVMAHRSAASSFGAATAPCKENREVVVYATEAEAQAMADKFNERILTPNVHYTVEPLTVN